MMQSEIENNRKYNLVYLIDGLGWGGAERLMIPILSNIDRQHFTTRVCVLQDINGNPIAKELRDLGITVDLLPVRYLRDFTASTRIINYLRDVKADLLHAQLEFSTVLGGIAAKWLGIPSVVTLHTLPSQEEGLKSRLHLALENFMLRHFFDSIISVSKETQRFYKQTAKIPDKKSNVIYNGVDVTHYSTTLPNRSTTLKELGIPSTATVIITVAVLRELKGIQYMIRAMPSLSDAQPQIYYLVVGGGEYYEPLQDEVKKAGVHEKVVFTGARKDIPALMTASDLFVLPTLTEALPTVLAEAMALGLPILASRVGGVPEMIQEDINGKLIEPADPQTLAAVCLEMLKDPQRLRQMGNAGRKIAEEKFNIKTQVQQLQNLYLRLIYKSAQH
ncbi:MAG: glycosyltransferase [Anaerolineales bacterium]|nr:glycosyltransferase [Anaerolineales bacterium]